MSALFATVVISTVLVVQQTDVDPNPTMPAARAVASQGDKLAVDSAGPAVDAEVRASIERAIKDLSDDRFIVRKTASQTLWRIGLAAEPALRDVATSRDREVRNRAKRILSDFDYGIIPGVPANVMVWLNQFREGDARQRQVAFDQLLLRRQFDTVERLMLFERDANVRRRLLVKLFDDAYAIERFIEMDRIASLIKAVGADQDLQWRRTMMAGVLSTPKMLKRLMDTGKLNTLFDFIQNEKDARIRDQLLLTVLRTPGAVAALIKNDQLDFAFTAMKSGPDKAVRGEWLLALLAAPGATAAILEKGKLDEVLAFAKENSDSSAHKRILEQLFRTPSVVAKLLEDPGFDSLIAMVDDEKDPKARGELLANLIMSSDMRNHLKANGKDALIVTLARDEKDLAARHAYLDRLFRYGSILYSIKSQDSLRTLWSLVKSDPDRQWRTVAISRMLATSRVTQLLDDPKETAWLLKWLLEEDQVATRSQLLAAIVNNYSLRRKLADQGHFDKLFALVKKEAESVRSRLLLRLISSSDSVEFFKDKEKAAELVTLVAEFTNPKARTEYVTGLFKNHRAMTALIEFGHYDALAKLATGSEDPVIRAILYGQFVQTQPVIEQLKKKGELDSLIVLAKDEKNTDAQHAFLQLLFRNHNGLGALIDAGHFETLLALATKTEPQDRRAALMADFYAAPKVISALIAAKDIESLVTFATSQQADVRQKLLERLRYNQQAIGALVDNGHFETLMTMVNAVKNPSSRVSLMGTILGSPPVIKHLTSQDNLGSILTLVSRETDAKLRETLLTQILNRSDTVAAFVDKGLLPSILTLINQTTGSRREQLLGQVLFVPKVLEYLVEQKRLSMVLGVIDNSPAANGRTSSYLQRLFYSSTTLTLLIKNGFFDDLLDITLRQTNAAFRATLMGRLFALDVATQQLVQNNRVGFFLSAVKGEASGDARRNLLTQLIRSKSVVAALIESKEIEVLITICLEDKEDVKRRALLSELLVASDLLLYLGKTDRLAKVMTDVLAEKDQAKLRSTLERLLTNSESMKIVTRYKQMPSLIALVETGLDDIHRKALVSRLANSQSGIEWMVKAGKSDLLMVALNETSTSRRGYLLRNILYTDKALSKLLANGHFEVLLKYVGHESNASLRRSMLGTLVFSTASLEYLAKVNQLDRVFKIATDEADNNFRRQCIQAFLYRTEGRGLFHHPIVVKEIFKLFQLETESNQSSFVRQMMAAPRIRQGVIRAGQTDVLREIVALEKDQVRRQTYLDNLLYTPSGVVAWHIQRGEYKLAEEILVENADVDRGRMRLATYLRSRNLLNDRVDAMQHQLQTTPDQVDQRLLLYLLRAQGDLPGALELATKLGDEGLLRAIFVEDQSWNQAAALQVKSACPLPVPIATNNSITQAYPEIEQLSYLATFQRLAGQTEAFANSIDKIQQLQQANPNDQVLGWHCAEALLLNGHVDETLAFLSKTHPRRAFAMHVFQHRYGDALQLVGLPRETTINRSWFDKLHGAGNNDAAKNQDRFVFALHIMRVLSLLGQTDDRDALLAVLTSVVEAMPTPTNTTPPANAFWEQISQSLFRLGLNQQAWEFGSHAVSPRTYSPALLSRLYGSRASEANAWWRFLRSDQPSEAVPQTLDRLHRILYPQSIEAKGDFSALAKQAEMYAESITGISKNVYLLGIGSTCQKRGETVIALRCLKGADSYSTAAMQHADLVAELNQPLEAARLYEQIWEHDNEQLGALYLSGHAYEQAGRVDEASHHKQLARDLAIDSRARQTMASTLAAHGLQSEAIEQWKFIQVTAPFEHWVINEAVRRLALAEPDQPALAAGRWIHYMLGDLRNAYYMMEIEGYLRVPTTIRRLQASAALEAGDFKAAVDMSGLAAALSPGDTTLAEELVPAFDLAAQPAFGNKVFETLYLGYEKRCEQYPKSAFLHNNLAWLAARCGRRIDSAMEHAKQAVELAPNNGSYLDTLAEVYFRQGDREAAVRHSKRAVEASPGRASLREQLARFTNDPLP